MSLNTGLFCLEDEHALANSPIRKIRFFTLGGTFKRQMPDQNPGRLKWVVSTRSSTHNLYVLRTEYKPFFPAFQINLSLGTWSKSGAFRIEVAMSSLKTCFTKSPFQLLELVSIKLSTVKSRTKCAPMILPSIQPPFNNQGSSRIGIEVPEPILHREPPRIIKRACRILRQT